MLGGGVIMKWVLLKHVLNLAYLAQALFMTDSVTVAYIWTILVNFYYSRLPYSVPLGHSLPLSPCMETYVMLVISPNNVENHLLFVANIILQ
jgi:hypothetical protein